MSREVRVPSLPESVAEATVLAWHKRTGEPVTQGEILVELETDKVVLEVPAPQDGALGEIQAPEGAVVTTDALLALIVEASGVAAEAPRAAPAPAPVTTSPAPPPPAGPAPADEPLVTPSARRLVKEMNLDTRQIDGSGRDGRIQKADVLAYLDVRETAAPASDPE
ncbi:biotin/lipoyl-containing protein, partial [Thiocystis violacea]|uniref:biotin/lipoyl-containing protein n=1 Tax=Thiocystis violacea TaxID=13725 RepID=UPI001906797A